MECLIKLFVDAFFASMVGIPLGFIIVEIIHLTKAMWNEKMKERDDA